MCVGGGGWKTDTEREIEVCVGGGGLEDRH